MTPDEALELFAAAKRAYQVTYNTPPGESVQADLAIFCHANTTTAVLGDRDQTLILEGRRQVWLRIREYLDLSPEELVMRRNVGPQNRSDKP